MHEQIRRKSLRIVEIARNDKAPIHSFAEAISADPLFVARLIRLVNFVPGLAQRPTILSNAINVFGLDNLKALALGLSAFTFDVAREQGENGEVDDEAINRRDLWEHALGCAIVAARLASKNQTVSPLVAFTAGFIHDVGKVLLYRYSKEKFMAALSVVLEKNIPSTEGEMLALALIISWRLKTGAANPIYRSHCKMFCACTISGWECWK